MELTEALDELSAGLADAKAKGNTAIEIVNLETYILDLRKRAALSAHERGLQHAAQLETFKAQQAFSIEGFRSVIEAGKEAINAAIIINGGAVIAMLSFIGTLLGKNPKIELGPFSAPLVQFGAGTFLGALSFGGRYLSQFLYFYPTTRTAGHWSTGATWVAMIGAYTLFVFGVYGTNAAIQHLH